MTETVERLPGEPIMWVLIVSELLVFGAVLAAFLAVRATDPEIFAQSQALLDREAGALNTLVLVTSGLCAAFAVRAGVAARPGRARLWLFLAIALGVVFLVVKGLEYADKAALGIDIDTNAFFTFYYLGTGFHALHVVAGIVILLLVGWRAEPHGLEVGAAFWHMVDLIWVLLFPVIYLLG